MQILDKVNKLLLKHNYKVEVESLLTSKMLIISSDSGDILPFTLAIGTYPNEEEDRESTFLQFYFQYTLKSDQKKLTNLNESIISQNKLLPIGHFGTNNEDNYLFYKYVLVISEKNIEESTIITVMDMVIYIMQAMLPEIN